MTGQPAPTPEEEAVGEALRALTSNYPALPSSVAERLDRTLAELPDLAPPSTADSEPVRTPRRRRWFALSGAMATVVAVTGFILIQTGSDPQIPSANNSAESTGEDPANSADGVPSGEYIVTYTGHDYGPGGLEEILGNREPGLTAQSAELAEPLSSDATQRDACVALLEETFAGTVSKVDFGFYDAVPTMVAILGTGGDGPSYAIAVGTQCGVDGIDLIARDEIPPSR